MITGPDKGITEAEAVMLGEPALDLTRFVCDKALTARPAESSSDLTTSSEQLTLCDMRHVTGSL